MQKVGLFPFFEGFFLYVDDADLFLKCISDLKRNLWGLYSMGEKRETFTISDDVDYISIRKNDRHAWSMDDHGLDGWSNTWFIDDQGPLMSFQD